LQSLRTRRTCFARSTGRAIDAIGPGRAGYAGETDVAFLAFLTVPTFRSAFAVRAVAAVLAALAIAPVAHERQALGHHARSLAAQVDKLGAILRDERLRLRLDQRALACPGSLLLGERSSENLAPRVSYSVG
jgi:hypothetical protein